jgi:hypothetical protein
MSKCQGLCKNLDWQIRYKNIEFQINPPLFSKKQLNYAIGSRCKYCEVWIPIPKYTYPNIDIIYMPNPDQYEIFRNLDFNARDENDKPILDVRKKMIVLEDKSGITVIVHIPEISTDVYCSCCKNKASGKRLHKEKRDYIKQKPDTKEDILLKLEQTDDSIKRLKVQLEYENDQSLRLDTKEAKLAGITGSPISSEIQTSLNRVKKYREILVTQLENYGAKSTEQKQISILEVYEREFHRQITAQEAYELGLVTKHGDEFRPND